MLRAFMSRPPPRSILFVSTTCPAELLRLVDRHQPAVVIVEACLLSGWGHDLCEQHSLKCRVADTASEAWKFQRTKRQDRLILQL